MTEQNQSRFKRLKAFVIGGKSSERAALCYSSPCARFAFEPLESLEELSASDLAVGHAYVLANDTALLHKLRSRLVEAKNFSAPIIAFASQAGVEDVVRAFGAGASSFIDAPFSAQRVQDAVAAAVQKSQFLGAHTDRSLAAKLRLRQLTAREREVVDAMADGLSNKLIGRRLLISPRTVEIHRANAFDKLAVSHTAEAIRLVLEANFYDTLWEELGAVTSTVSEPQVCKQA